MIQSVDFNSWPRKAIYDFFGEISDPFYMVTFRQDVTDIRSFAKRNGLSFYLCMVYLVSGAFNSVEAFRYTVREGDLYLLDERLPSFTDLPEDSDEFRIITMPELGENIFTFCAKAEARRIAQKDFIDQSGETDGLIYLSCLPWFDLTALTNERDLSTKESRESNIPSIAWGRYEDHAGRKELGLSIEVNHRFIDGIHLGQFKNALDRLIRNLPERI